MKEFLTKEMVKGKGYASAGTEVSLAIISVTTRIFFVIGTYLKEEGNIIRSKVEEITWVFWTLIGIVSILLTLCAPLIMAQVASMGGLAASKIWNTLQIILVLCLLPLLNLRFSISCVKRAPKLALLVVFVTVTILYWNFYGIDTQARENIAKAKGKQFYQEKKMEEVAYRG